MRTLIKIISSRLEFRLEGMYSFKWDFVRKKLLDFTRFQENYDLCKMVIL